jgi:ureidoacrylate peracid hydrolase
MATSHQSTRTPLLASLADKLKSDRVALVVVDMQNDFCSEGGFLTKLGVDLTDIRAAIPKIGELLETARRRGIMIVHLYYDGNPEYFDAPMLERLARKDAEGYCLPNTWGIEIVPELQPLDGELVIGKHRYSGFFGTDLNMRLRGAGVETVVLTGVGSNNCVDGTGRDAYYHGFYVVVASDAAAAPSRALHEATLQTVEHAYGEVADVATIVAEWESS